jgi:hypothetical protein
MYSQALLWLLDTGKLTVRYILVGFAFIPVGLIYVELALHGHASVPLMVVFLALGTLLANAVWKLSAPKAEPRAAAVYSEAWISALKGPVSNSSVAFGLNSFEVMEGRISQRIENQRAPLYDIAGRLGAT